MGKILIVEDELIVAENIAAILESEGHEIIGIADHAEEALSLIKSNPDLILCDIYIKGNTDGIALAQHFESIPFLYLTAFADEQTVKRAAATRPLNYIVKPFTELQLIAAVNLVIHSAYKSKIPPPSKRELDVLALLVQGLGTKQIAEKLFLSEHTVQTHRKNLIQKYNVQSSLELVSLAIREKWVNP